MNSDIYILIALVVSFVAWDFDLRVNPGNKIDLSSVKRFFTYILTGIFWPITVPYGLFTIVRGLFQAETYEGKNDGQEEEKAIKNQAEEMVECRPTKL